MAKRSVLILLTLISLMVMGFSLDVAPTTHPNQNSNVTFKTPEDAVTYYLQGVAQGDFNKVLQACAIDESSQNFKFDLLIDRLQAFIPNQALAPSTAPMYVELNKAQLSAQIASQVKIFVFSLLSTQPVDKGGVIRMDIDAARKFIGEVDATKLAQLQIKKIGIPNPTIMNSAKNLQNEAKIAKVYGADDATERVVLFSFGSDDYATGFLLFRYGDNWKVYSQTSPLAGMSTTGAAGKMTPDDFDKLVNGN